MTTPAWTEERAQTWLAKLDGMEAELAPVSDVLFEAAALQPGLDVLDVGCGPGSTTRRAAELVGPSGSATGLDISPAMISAARGLSAGRPVQWVVADIGRDGLAEAAYDVVVSRFGVMFFSDPVVAFGRLATATRPGGRLCTAVWRSPGDVPFFDVPYDIVVGTLQANGIVLDDVQSPGSSLGDPSATGAMLEAAGWSDVSFQPSDTSLHIGGPLPLDEAIDVALGQGPVRALLSEQPESTITLARAALRQELTPLYDGVGLPLPGGFMIITATRT